MNEQTNEPQGGLLLCTITLVVQYKKVAVPRYYVVPFKMYSSIIGPEVLDMRIMAVQTLYLEVSWVRVNV